MLKKVKQSHKQRVDPKKACHALLFLSSLKGDCSGPQKKVCVGPKKF